MKQIKKITKHLLVLILFLCIKSVYGQQICQNGGFEDGATGYQGYNGILDYHDLNYCTPNILPNHDFQVDILNLSSATIDSSLVIVPNIQDPYTPLQMVDTGASAIRINQRLTQQPFVNTDQHEAMLKKDFTALAGVTSVSFRFAYVIEALGIADTGAGSHTFPDDDAYIKASIHNGAGAEITTLDSRFCLRANINDCIFQEGNPASGSYYTDWATVTLDFDPTPYLDQKLSLRIEVSDCSIDEHYSYAYVDNICTSLQEEPAGLLCCAEDPNELFNIQPSGLLGGADPCDDTTQEYNFVVRDFLNQTVNNTTYPGVEFAWTNNNTGLMGSGPSFQAMVNEPVSVILTINGCSGALHSTQIVCDTTDLCQSCSDADIIIDGIIDNFSEVTGNCGLYSIAFEDISLDCNDIAYIFWENDVDFEVLTPSQPIQHQYPNGTFTPIVKLYRGGIEISNLCIEDTIPQITVNCDDIPDCTGCNLEPQIITTLTRECTVEAFAFIDDVSCYEDVQYSWDFNGEATATGSNPPSQSPSINGQYVITLTTTYSVNGMRCSTISSKSINIQCLSIDNECPSCTEIGTGITAAPTENCGEYIINVPNLGQNCYTVEVNLGDGSSTILLSTGVNIVNYEENGLFSPVLSISQNGNTCFLLPLTADIDCFNTCRDCESVGNNIFNSITESNDVCGDFTIEIPDLGTCYTMVANFQDGNGEVSLSPGSYSFHYDQNGDYSISLQITNEDGQVCFNEIYDLEVSSYYVPSGCDDWPKFYGSNNLNDPELWDSEYTSNVVKDSNGDVIILGYARSGADIEGTILQGRTYLAKYSSDGCTVYWVREVDFIKRPMDMLINNNDELTILSSENRELYSNTPNTYFITRLDTNSQVIWTSQIESTTRSVGFDKSFNITQNLHTNDIYVSSAVQRVLGGNLISLDVTDALQNNNTFNTNVILRFNAAGVLNWYEEVTSNPSSSMGIVKASNIEYDNYINQLLVVTSTIGNNPITLNTSNVEIAFQGPSNRYYPFIIKYTIDPSNNSINYSSNSLYLNGPFGGTTVRPSTQSIVSDQGHYYIYILLNGNAYITITDKSNNYVNTIYGNHISNPQAFDFKHNFGDNHVLYTGKNTGGGAVVGKFKNGELKWRHGGFSGVLTESYALDATSVNDSEIIVVGRGTGGSLTPQYGYHGFAARLIDDCDTVYNSRQSEPLKEAAIKSKKTSTLSMYPNPFTDQFKIGSTEDSQIKSIEIFNVYGMLMQRQPYKAGETIYFSKGTSGLYFVKIYLRNGEVQIRNVIKK